MRVNEIFYSIQGEGVYQGLPTVFVRLQGCNLLPNFCSYCDTKYAQSENGGEEKSVEEVVQNVIKLYPYQMGWGCITGGEPLFQPDVLEQLVRELKKQQYHIEVETNGSLPKPRWWALIDSWCADIKCPSSGVAGVSREEWFKVRPQDQVKFVVGTEEDLKFADGMIRKHIADNPIVLVSPVFPENYNEGGDGICIKWDWLQRCVEFAKERRVRFSLQWHKVVWGDQKGV